MSPQREGLVRVYAPIATDNGKPIVGIVRSEVIVAKVAFDASLADRDHIAYPVADPDDPAEYSDGARHDRRAAPLHPEERMEIARWMEPAGPTRVIWPAAFSRRRFTRSSTSRRIRRWSARDLRRSAMRSSHLKYAVRR